MNTTTFAKAALVSAAFAAAVIAHFLAHAAPAAEPPASEGAFQWVETPGESIELRQGERPVVRYMCAPYDDSSKERRDATYKVFHHVFSPDGSRLLTKGDPGGLYPHHRGLFYGFNKVTYGDGKTCDIWHCQGQTRQEHASTVRQDADEDSGSHVVAIDWHGRDGEVFAREERGVAAHALPGGMQIDFTSRVETADGQPIHVDGDPQHAGFHFRAAQEVAASTAAQTYYLRTDGKGAPRETRNWEPGKPADDPKNAECENRPWNALSIVVGGQRYTVLYLDHPDNPKPARYSERDYGRFGSYFAADITAEQPLEVRYRVWVQEGEMTVDQCTAMHEAFAGT